MAMMVSPAVHLVGSGEHRGMAAVHPLSSDPEAAGDQGSGVEEACSWPKW